VAAVVGWAEDEVPGCTGWARCSRPQPPTAATATTAVSTARDLRNIDTTVARRSRLADRSRDKSIAGPLAGWDRLRLDLSGQQVKRGTATFLRVAHRFTMAQVC
jgi:hypothetical protein